MTEALDPTELETAILAVYRGPLEEFISRRDALARQLRAAKRRDDADRVKALRKPSRTAWVLDTIVHDDPTAIEQLVEAINAAQTVQSGADLRTAMETIRGAVRAVAAAGTRVAVGAGQPVDANALSMALHAVIGETRAFEDLRAGRLVDVPDGGGLDILAALPTLAPPPPRPPPPAPPDPPAKAPSSPRAPNVEVDARSAAREAAQKAAHAAAAAARADLRQAETALADAREHSRRVARAVEDAQARLDAAQQALSRAEAEARARRADVERARRDADAAATRVREAEHAVAGARARISDSDPH